MQSNDFPFDMPNTKHMKIEQNIVFNLATHPPLFVTMTIP